MLNGNAPETFTAQGDPQAEELLKKTLADIADELKDTRLTVVLGGSYGRGEGGVRSDRSAGLLYNDLDFFVFSDDPAQAGKISLAQKLHTVAKKYEKILNVDIDFSAVTTVKNLQKNSRRLMMQELKRGYRLLCGKDVLADHLLAFPPEALPFSEACRLLLNRGMGLLLAGEKIEEKSTDHGFILRNIYKAVLGAGDALMIVKNIYKWRSEQKKKTFDASPYSDKWKKLYTDACNFKITPHAVLPEDPRQLWLDTREFFLGAVLEAADTADKNDLAKALFAKSKESGECSYGNYFKYCIKTRTIASPEPHTAPAVVNLLPALFEALAADTRQINRAGVLYRHWQIFN